MTYLKNIHKEFLLILLLSSICLSHGEIEPSQNNEYEDEITSLTQNDFYQYVFSNKYTFVMFYLANCSYSEAFQPEFESIEKKWNTENPDTYLNFAKIEATQNPSIMEDFGIETYPSFSMMIRGNAKPYNSKNSADTMYRWIQAVQGKKIINLDSIESMEKEIEKYEMIKIFTGDEFSPQHDIIKDLNMVFMRNEAIYTVNNSDILTKLGIETKNTQFLFNNKDNDQRVSEFKILSEALDNLQENGSTIENSSLSNLPTITKILTYNNIKKWKYLAISDFSKEVEKIEDINGAQENGLPILCFFVKKEDPFYFREVIENLEPQLKDETLARIFVEPDQDTITEIKHIWNITVQDHDQAPDIFIVTFGENDILRYRFTYPAFLNDPSKIVDFFEKYKNNSLETYKKNQNISESELEDGPITHINTMMWEFLMVDLMKKSGLPFFIFLHNEELKEDCEKAYENFKIIAQKFKSNNANIRFYAHDIMKNEVHNFNGLEKVPIILYVDDEFILNDKPKMFEGEYDSQESFEEWVKDIDGLDSQWLDNDM